MTKEIMITAGEIENGEIFRIGDLQFVKFFEEDGKVVIMAANSLFVSDFGPSADLHESFVLQELKEGFLPHLAEMIGENNIYEFDTDLSSFHDKKTGFGMLREKVSLPTSTFYNEHKNIFDKHALYKDFWLATPDVDRYVTCVLFTDRFFVTCDEAAGVRPVCVIDSSVSVYVQPAEVEEEVSIQHEMPKPEKKIEKESEPAVQSKESDIHFIQESPRQNKNENKKYQKAHKEQEEKQMTNFTNFSIALDNLSVEDRTALLALIEKSKAPLSVSDIETGKPFRIGDVEFIKIAAEDGKVLAVTRDEVWDSPLTTTVFTKSEIYEDINNTFLPGIINVIGEENLLDFETDTFGIDGVQGECFVSKVSLMTFDFYRKNKNIFDDYRLAKSFWLATKNGSGYVCVSPTGTIKTNRPGHISCLVRPIIALNLSTIVNPT